MAGVQVARDSPSQSRLEKTFLLCFAANYRENLLTGESLSINCPARSFFFNGVPVFKSAGALWVPLITPYANREPRILRLHSPPSVRSKLRKSQAAPFTFECQTWLITRNLGVAWPLRNDNDLQRARMHASAYLHTIWIEAKEATSSGEQRD